MSPRQDRRARHEEPRWRAAVKQSRAATAPRPVAVVIPGTMGSALAVRGRPVWLAYWTLLRGGLADIGWGVPDVRRVGDIETGSPAAARAGSEQEPGRRSHRKGSV